MKIVYVVGARPQFIKLGPLSRELRKDHEEYIIHTGQHYDNEMSTLFFEQLEIPKPDINLSIGSGNHGDQTGKMLQGIEKEILEYKPDLVIYFGDTNSTLAACLAASKLGIRTIHIEAGLRSFNRSMPEEINRIVADHTSDLLFAPTKEAIINLKKEGLQDKTILTGDIMVDSVSYIQKKLKKEKSDSESFYLMTLHRPYNVDNPEKIRTLFEKLRSLEDKIIFPVHPRTKKIVKDNNIDVPYNMTLIPPQGYIEFHRLLRDCTKIITDSGGIQKEAYLVGKPCITLRPETEWVETVEAGWNILLNMTNKNLTESIKIFKPNGSKPDLFGSNVSLIMKKEINKLFSMGL